MLDIIKPHVLCKLSHGFALNLIADTRNRKPQIDRRFKALAEEGRIEIDLAVGHRDKISRDKTCDITLEGIGNGKECHRAAPQFRREPPRPFHKLGMQIEYIAGIGLSAGRPLQKQRYLAIGPGMLG